MLREYIVTKELLNIRSRPTEESDFKGDLKLNSNVWLDDQEILGTVPLGGETNRWLVYNTTSFVSKDGLRVKGYEDKKAEFVKDQGFSHLHNSNLDENQWNVSWGNIFLDIWKIWRDYKTKGELIEVAIIDSGIGRNVLDLDNVKNKIYAPQDGGSSVDEVGHGTLTAGIIGATGKLTIYGIAPNCQLTIIKREGVDGLLSEEFDYKSLKAVGKNIDILNISSEFVTNSKRIFDELTRIANQGTLIVVAAGDGISKLNNNIFPANHPNVISITALDKKSNLYFQALFNQNTKWIIPGEQLLSCDQFGTRSFHDATSAATPFMSGILCLCLSFNKINGLGLTNTRILEILKNNSTEISSEIDNKKVSFCLPNLISTFLELHSHIK